MQGEDFGIPKDHFNKEDSTPLFWKVDHDISIEWRSARFTTEANVWTQFFESIIRQFQHLRFKGQSNLEDSFYGLQVWLMISDFSRLEGDCNH